MATLRLHDAPLQSDVRLVDRAMLITLLANERGKRAINVNDVMFQGHKEMSEVSRILGEAQSFCFHW
jgi:hypothetical protein